MRLKKNFDGLTLIYLYLVILFYDRASRTFKTICVERLFRKTFLIMSIQIDSISRLRLQFFILECVRTYHRIVPYLTVLISSSFS